MGCCFSIGPQLEAEASSTPNSIVQASDVSGPSAECAEQEQGNGGIPRPHPDQLKDLPSASSPATHTDEKGKTEHKVEPGLGLDQAGDLPSFPGSVTHPNGNGETEHAEPEPGPDQPNDLSTSSSAGSITHTDDNEEMGHEENYGSGADQPEDLPSSSATHIDKNEEMGIKEGPGHGSDQPQGVPSSSDSAARTNENEETVITSIRATDVALGLRRLPAGFYAVVDHSGFEWRTEPKRSSVNDDVVEWCGPISIPSDLLATVCLRIYASFEFQPMLGTGEQLREFIVTVEELLNRSEKGVPLTLSPNDRDVVYPCSSILVTVKRQKCESSDFSLSTALDPHCSTTESLSDLENATNQGHSALSRYRKLGEKRDLECSIQQFERALSICPLEHPCRAAAQSNLAMAKFIHFQVEDASGSFEVPLSLYREALAARPVGHLDRPSTLIQLAVVHFTRSEKQRDKVEGARAEALLHEVIGLGSADSYEIQAATFMLQMHVRRRVGPVQTDVQASVEQDLASPMTVKDLRTLSAWLLRRFGRFGDLTDLQRAITILEELVRSTPPWDGQYREELANLGVALSYRFNRLGKLNDLGDAILRHRNAVELTPRGHPDKPIYLNNLGNTLDIRFKRLGEPTDLEDAISTLRDAVDLTPRGHPVKSSRLSNLGNSFLARFQLFEDLSDLEHAIARFRDAVDLTPHDQPHNPALLNNLGNCFFLRFGRLGELSDLHVAISRHKDAVDLTAHDHPEKPLRLNNLGNDFQARFKRLGELNDLENAISTLKDAVELTPHGHVHKPGRLSNLGNCFLIRFRRLGELSDLDVAISRHKDAVDFTPHGHPDKSSYLNNLGNAFQTRFKRLGELSDLENAISTLKDAVELTPHGRPHKPTLLNNLATSFFLRFEYLGELNDLEDAISRHTDAVALAIHGHPHNPIYLHSLGNTLHARFQYLGEAIDLEDAISTLQDAVDLTPHGHPDKSTHLNSLGSAFVTRFERLGELSNIEAAISTLSNAVELTPRGHPHMAGCLDNLGNSLNTRFEHIGEPSDLEDAISALRNAVELTPHGHSDKPNRLSRLGRSFRARFERFGELGDLEDAISTLKDAVDLTPNGHPRKPIYLNNLGNSFITRFERLGEHSDLENAISTLRDAVDLTPHGHPHKPTILNSLGGSFIIHFKYLGELSNLEDAISTLRNAVEVTPQGHPHKAGCLNNLGSSFEARFECLRELNDLEVAISMLTDAVDLTPHGHPLKPTLLHNLGNSFTSRFKHLGELGDLEAAISRHRDVVELTPHGHPYKPSSLNCLGSSFVTRFERLGEQSDLEQAISLYSHAASASIGPIGDRFQASQNWISCARRVRHHSLLRAYSVAINLLPQLAWIGLSLTHRYHELKQGTDVVREAAAAALGSGLQETAVEWLEQGRSIVWGELFQLRNSYEELSSAHPDHARRLRELSAALEDASITREKSFSALLEQTQSAAHRTVTTESLQQEADRHRRLAIQRDELLQEIRGLRGFERFLRRKEFSQLRASAQSGPVAILNAAESRCDALIILADVDHVIHAPLPNFTFKRTADLQNTLKSFVRHAREGQSVTWDGVTWESFLSPLWKCVVKPVLDTLAFSIPGDLSRIFWCPTGPFVFLPIHAAGFYDTEYLSPGHKVYDFVVSSYVPTLSILAQSPNPSAAGSGDLRLLAVRQPPSDGQSPLPGVAIELHRIKEVIKNLPSACTTLLEPSVGTVEEVLALMREADWVHFACHGIQDGVNSGLCLADGRCLKLRDIIALSRSRGGLAFLSACQTAKGEERLSDEAVHIAAGMLFAGYGGVVGTMWSISDRLAPDVARDVYEHLFQNGTRPDYREAARALHEAIASLRDSGSASFDEWIPFIHVGL